MEIFYNYLAFRLPKFITENFKPFPNVVVAKVESVAHVVMKADHFSPTSVEDNSLSHVIMKADAALTAGTNSNVYFSTWFWVILFIILLVAPLYIISVVLVIWIKRFVFSDNLFCFRIRRTLANKRDNYNDAKNVQLQRILWARNLQADEYVRYPFIRQK